MNKSTRPFNLPSTIAFIERDWLSANNVVLFDDHRATVVDTGYKKHTALTAQLLEFHCAHYEQTNRHRLKQSVELTRIVNTHLHSDHCGGNAMLQQRYPDIQTHIPQACATMVEQWDEAQLTYSATNQECDRFSFTHTIAFGQTLQLGGFEWHVHGAPGHDHTMFVLHCPELKLLISADALWENGFGVTFPELDDQSGFAEHQSTLDLISRLDVDWVIPGHGAAFTDIGAALDRAYSKLQYLREDPVRHEKMAARVLLKFLLLDREKIALADLSSILGQARLFRRLLGNPLDPQAQQSYCLSLARHLCVAGAAKQDELFLYNC